MKREQMIGILVFVVIAAVGAFIWYYSNENSSFDKTDRTELITLKGYIGGEKKGFLENEQTKQILEKSYGIKLDWSKAGSIEMVRGNLRPDMHFLWPSSQVALELFKLTQKRSLVKSDIIFHSPIVIYSWDLITDALVKEDIISINQR
jgi:hypothetical protein